MKVYAISDIHADYADNLAWLHSLSADEFTDDVLILAGDVSDKLDLLSEVFDALLLKFSKLFFVPGNHELWVKGSEFECSLEKLAAIKELCGHAGVITDCHKDGDITFVPLYSWYDYSFAEPDAYLKRAWRDYKACSWPAHLQSSADINRHFLNMNLPVLQKTNKVVISYSHFLPRIDLMPAGIPQTRRKVYPVLGSESLGYQVARLNPDIHVYGHSHVNRSIQLDGIHYVNNAFGYPSELRITSKQLRCIYHNGMVQTDKSTGRGN